RTEFFEASDSTSVCPYKGRARYWSVRVGDAFVKYVAWSYPDPIPENPKIRDLVAFFQERMDIVVDGAGLARPATPWSTVDGAGGHRAAPRAGARGCGPRAGGLRGGFLRPVVGLGELHLVRLRLRHRRRALPVAHVVADGGCAGLRGRDPCGVRALRLHHRRCR